MESIAVNDVISAKLADMNKTISNELKGDCVFVCANMILPLDDVFREIIEGLKENNSESRHLIVLLETAGGYIETVERMVSVMRKHYKEVSFVVPSHAYSAGTVLVLSGDRIYMDYYSVLGPIDPQYPDSENQSNLLPGAGYLAKFKEMTDKINKDPDNSYAELMYLQRFDPAKLFHIEQSIQHGRSLIANWLSKYKFKNWNNTETRKQKVSSKMRKDRAEEIARILGDAERWHSHGRGITMQELCDDEIKLKIDDFGKDDHISHAIRNYRGMCVDFAKKNEYS